MTITGRVHVRVVEDNTDRVVADLERHAEAIVATFAARIVAGAQQLVARHGLIDTGNLLNSIQARRLAAARWLVYVGAHYGIYHEMGTRYMVARPFLIPAAEAERTGFHTAMRQVAA